MKKSTWILCLALAITGILSLENIVNAQPVFGPNSAELTNTYFPLKVGDKFTYKNYGFPLIDYQYIEAIKQEKIDQVECLKIKYSESPSYVDYHWFAEDTSGNIWLLQYYDVLNGLTHYGKNNAKLSLPSQVNVGSIVFGSSTVVATGVTVPILSTGLGPYYNCIKTRGYYGDGDFDYGYMASGVGVVKDEWNDDGGINGFDIFSIYRANVKKPKSMPWLLLLLE